MEYVGNGEAYCSKSLWNNSKESGKENEETEDEKKNLDHPDHSTAEIRRNTLESPRDLRQYAIIQTLLKTISYICVKYLPKENKQMSQTSIKGI